MGFIFSFFLFFFLTFEGGRGTWVYSFFFSEDRHRFYFFIFQKQIEEGKWSVRLFFIKKIIFCLFIFICKLFVTFFYS